MYAQSTALSDTYVVLIHRLGWKLCGSCQFLNLNVAHLVSSLVEAEHKSTFCGITTPCIVYNLANIVKWVEFRLAEDDAMGPRSLWPDSCRSSVSLSHAFGQ